MKVHRKLIVFWDAKPCYCMNVIEICHFVFIVWLKPRSCSELFGEVFNNIINKCKFFVLLVNWSRSTRVVYNFTGNKLNFHKAKPPLLNLQNTLVHYGTLMFLLILHENIARISSFDWRETSRLMIMWSVSSQCWVRKQNTKEVVVETGKFYQPWNKTAMPKIHWSRILKIYVLI